MLWRHTSGKASLGPAAAQRTRLRPKLSRRVARWVNRAINLSVLGFVLLAILGGMFQRWTFFADVHRRQAMGDKVLVGDFVTIAPPNDQNSAVFILKAIDQLQLSPHQEWLIDDVKDYRLSGEAKSFAIQYNRSHPQIRALLEKARTCPYVDWHVKWRSPALEVDAAYLKRQREFARFLYAVGICQHESGDDVAALQTAQEIFFLAHAVDTRSTFIGHLVANGLENMGANFCLRLCDPATSPTARHDQNLGAVVQPLIVDLCDDAQFRRGFDAGLRADRMVMVDAIIHLPTSRFSAFCLNYPIFSGARALLEDYDGWIRGAALPSWPAAATLVPAERPTSEPFLVIYMGPSLRRVFLLEYETEAERHAAAIAIACRLYADDHDGKWPADLSALVPHYLRAIPYDPFDVHLRPMKYLPSNPPAIYSISMNGIDNHGDRTGAVSYKYGFNYDPWQSPDAVFPIGGVVEPADKRAPEHGDE